MTEGTGTSVGLEPRATLARGNPGAMSYAEAKQIALLRLELRACWRRADRAAAGAVLARLSQVAGNDNEIAAEVRRWRIKLA